MIDNIVAEARKKLQYATMLDMLPVLWWVLHPGVSASKLQCRGNMFDLLAYQQQLSAM